MALQLSEQEIVKRAINLPAFPRIVKDVLETLDDDNATLDTLVRLVETDPVITARIVSAASAAAQGTRHGNGLRNVQTAISLIGLARVRDIALAVSLAQFTEQSRMSAYFWEHSLAVGIAAQELGRFNRMSLNHAFVAGLLHDIGHLWMARFQPLEFQMVRNALNTGSRAIVDIEQEYFGTDHCAIGEILARQWKLPSQIATAIRHHHQPTMESGEKLVPLIHVAEVFANALDLTDRLDNHVTDLSDEACTAIGLNWDEDLRPLFGRIEARTEHACRIFR